MPSKKFAILILIFIFNSACDRLNTDVKKSSYALGQQIGGNLKKTDIDVDEDILIMGLVDSLKNENKLSEKEIDQAQMKIQEQLVKKVKAQHRETAPAASKVTLPPNKSSSKK